MPLLYLCVLLNIERPKEWLFAHGLRIRARIGSRWIEWRFVADSSYRESWAKQAATEIADEIEAGGAN